MISSLNMWSNIIYKVTNISRKFWPLLHLCLVSAFATPRRLFCSSSESLSCVVLSRSLHQPKMQCSCTTNQITGETLPLPRVSGHGPRRVFKWILRWTLCQPTVVHLQVATLLQVQDVWDVVQFIAPTLSALHTDPPGLHEWRGPNVLSNVCGVGSCNERVHPECSTRRCTLHCASPDCPFHSCPNGTGAGTRWEVDPRSPMKPSVLALSMHVDDGVAMGQSMTDSEFWPTSSVFGLFLSCASRRSRLENSLRFQLTSISTMTALRGLSGARQHFLCVMECAVSQSQAYDTTSVRWRVFGGSWCICSFYAPHAGVPTEISFTVPLASTVLWISPWFLPGMRTCGTLSFQTAHQALRFIGPSFCGFVDIVMQLGDLQSQGAGHPRWWRRFGLRFHLQKLRRSLSEYILATMVVMKRQFVVLCSGPSQPIPLPLGPSRMSKRRPLLPS